MSVEIRFHMRNEMRARDVGRRVESGRKMQMLVRSLFIIIKTNTRLLQN